MEKIDIYFAKLKQGKTKYFTPFYNLTKNAVFYTALAILNDRQRAEEITQDAYLTFLKKIDVIDGSNNPKYYLVTIARNLAINEAKRENHNIYTEDMDTYTSENICDAPLINYCKQHLSQEEWHIFELILIQGYKQIEVSKMLKIPVSTLNYYYKKILKKAKEFYQKVYKE